MNGWLVDEDLLDKLKERSLYPSFQLSFDGIGCHDFLRGVPGAEEKTIRALKLLQERDYRVSVSMCIHQGNRDTLRETANFVFMLSDALPKRKRRLLLPAGSCSAMAKNLKK